MPWLLGVEASYRAISPHRPFAARLQSPFAGPTALGKPSPSQLLFTHEPVPKLLDVAGAMNALPALPIALENGQSDVARIAVRATGTDNLTPSPLAPTLAPTAGKTRTLQSIRDKIAIIAEKSNTIETLAASAYPVKQNNPLTTAVSGLHDVGDAGLEPVASSLSSNQNRLPKSPESLYTLRSYRTSPTLASHCNYPYCFAKNRGIFAAWGVAGVVPANV